MFCATKDKRGGIKMFGGFFEKLKDGLTKTRNSITEKVSEVLNLAVTIDDELYEELEEILITSDIGVDTSIYVIEKLKLKVKQDKIKDPTEIRPCLKEVIIDILDEDESSIKPTELPKVLLIIGVNGVGKTTSIGKISATLKAEKYKVLIAAADTFRAAAIDQLEVWSNRAGVDLVKHQEGSDPAAVVFDAVQAAKARKVDVLICDTAGRLHNKKNLMDELGKINRVIKREYSEAHMETLLVLDATTGQNGVEQAKQFMAICPIDGIILTKLDGTAKGGVVISIKKQLNIPVKYIGVGEGIDDLQEFNARDFVEALF
jgi:fused signal recognition particle receptor